MRRHSRNALYVFTHQKAFIRKNHKYKSCSIRSDYFNHGCLIRVRYIFGSVQAQITFFLLRILRFHKK